MDSFIFLMDPFIIFFMYIHELTYGIPLYMYIHELIINTVINFYGSIYKQIYVAISWIE